MVRLRGSFLIRWWVLDSGGSRIELEHIQSGARKVTASPTEALAWIGESVAEHPAAADPTDPAEARRRDEKGGVGKP